MKYLRAIIGMTLCILGLVLTIIPGSTLLLLAGLVLISVDYAPARKVLAWVQKGMTKSAKRVDRFLHLRKFK